MDVLYENNERPLKKIKVNSKGLVEIRKPRTREFFKFYDLLKEWIINNDRVPSLTTIDREEKDNAIWLGHQLKNMRFDRLCLTRRFKMNEIFTWDYCSGIRFEEMYNKLIEWNTQNARYPYYKSENEYERMLANWCDYQRAMKNANEIQPHHKYKLNQLDGWCWKESFDIFYNELIIWITEHNIFPRQSTTDKYERRLATWCSSVRKRNKKNKIDDYHIKLLDNLEGWFWNRFSNSFSFLYELLVKFVEKHGRYPEKLSIDSNEKRLYKWYNKQRKLHNILSDDNKILLEKLPDWKWIEKDDVGIFNENFEEISRWISFNHRIPSVVSEFPLEKKLGRLCKGYRVHKEKLTEDMKNKLEQLEGWYWNLFEHYYVSLYDVQKWMVDSP